MKKIIYLFCSLTLVNVAKAQTKISVVDSLANVQKYYTIQIDVANGNIYLPIKKNVNSIKVNNNLFIDESKIFEVNKSKYVVNSKKYLTPKVGNFIKLVFTNVPKHEDINATVSFNNKNQEGASVLNNVLSKYQGAFENAVNKDTSNINKTISLPIESKKVMESIGEVNKQAKNSEIILDKALEDLKEIGKKADSILLPKNPKTRNTDPLWKLKNAQEIKQIIGKILRDTLLSKNMDSSNNKKLEKANTNLNNLNDFLDAAIVLIIDQKIVYTKVTEAITDYKLFLNTASNNLQAKYKSTIDSLVKELNKKDITNKALNDSIYNNRTIRIIPFQVDNSDMSVISLNFLRDGKLYAEREIILKNNHGFKMDFSTGFVAATLKDDNYRLYNRGSDSSAILSDSKGKFAVGFGFLVHAYFRTGSRANFALTSGFALNGSNQTVNYLLGASIPLGLEERFVISAGAIFGKVKQLSSGYNVSENLDSLINNSPTYTGNHWYKAIANTGVPLTERWKTGFFVGITYNLGELIGTKRNKSFKVN